jgi:hypothetical protein
VHYGIANVAVLAPYPFNYSSCRLMCTNELESVCSVMFGHT